MALMLVAAVQVSRATQRTPVVVELFTSEGCESCPPADTLLDTLVATQPVAGAQIIGLGQHVDYWDQLGWKDRFSSAALTERQRLYGARFHHDGIYTPQMVVDGRAEFVGSDANAARKAIQRALDARHGEVRIAIEPPAGNRISISVTATGLPRADADRADIVVVVTEDHLRSDVKRGENRGRTLTHAAVVRHLAAIGEAASDGVTAAQADIPLARDWQPEHLKVVAFVQERRSRTILASAVASVPNVR